MLWSTGETGSEIVVNQPGEYSVTASINNCEETSSIIIEATPDPEPVPDFTTDLTEMTICAGTSVSFANLSSDADSYLWTFTNETTGNVFTSQESDPVIVFDDTGVYNIVLSASTDCSQTTVDEVKTAYIEAITFVGADIVFDQATEVCANEPVTLTYEQKEGITYTWFINGIEAPAYANQFLSDIPFVDTEYTLISTNAIGCSTESKLTLTINTDCDPYAVLPNVITPVDEDGMNDYWHIPFADNNQNVRVEVYNRWGQKVWETERYVNNSDSSWKGDNQKGKLLPNGTYYYIIDRNDDSEILKGTITIVK